MHILDIDSPVKKRLNESGITKLMKSIESCEWAVVEEYENKIIGAAGLGGLLRLTTTTAASTRVSCIGHDIAEAQ